MRFAIRAGPAGGDQQRLRFEAPGLHEQLAECRMSRVRAGIIEHHFDEPGDLDLARRRAVIRERQMSALHRRLLEHFEPHPRFDAVLLPRERGAGGVRRDRPGFAAGKHRPAGGPDGAARNVAQQDGEPEIVLAEIVLPGREQVIPVHGESRAGGGEQHTVAAVEAPDRRLRRDGRRGTSFRHGQPIAPPAPRGNRNSR